MPYKEIVTARVVSRQNHQPVSGATVRVYDKDLVLDDFLGEATTDADGHFSVTFSSDDFQGQVTGFEARPDIFVEVTNPRHRQDHEEQGLRGAHRQSDQE